MRKSTMMMIMTAAFLVACVFILGYFTGAGYENKRIFDYYERMYPQPPCDECGLGEGCVCEEVKL